MKTLFLLTQNTRDLFDLGVDRNDSLAVISSLNHNVLSTQELTDRAEAVMKLIDAHDAVVISGIEKRPYPFDDFEFFAGYAYAKGKPVVVVGGFWKLGLYSPRVVSAEPETLIRTLKKIEKNLAPNPERENASVNGTSDQRSVPGGDGVGVEPAEAAATGGQPSTEVGDGSHI